MLSVYTIWLNAKRMQRSQESPNQKFSTAGEGKVKRAQKDIAFFQKISAGGKSQERAL